MFNGGLLNEYARDAKNLARVDLVSNRNSLVARDL